MPGPAVHVAAWGKRWPRRALAPARASSRIGTPILEAQFPDLRLVIEMAFGAGPNDDGPWTDVTGDVKASAVSMTVGRADEASQTQPAACSFVLDNTLGRYSKGPQSGNPGLRQDIPTRVRALLNGVPITRFRGGAHGITPGWDSTGKIPVAAVSAAGTLRRLNQGTQPLASAIRHYALAQPSLIAYWPCEDGAKAVTFASAIAGQQAMTTSTAAPKPASYSGFAASAPVPTLTAETWTAPVIGGATTIGGQVWFLIHVPAATLANNTRVASVNLLGTLTRIDVFYSTASSGSFGFNVYSGATLVTLGFAEPPPGGADAQNVLLGLSWGPSGADTFIDLEIAGLDNGNASSMNTTATNSSVSGIVSVKIAPDANANGVAVGHLWVQTQPQDLVNGGTGELDAGTAFVGEAVTDRITRLCAEQSEPVSVTGVSAQTMGPQLTASFISLLRDCELVDLGILLDGLGPGIAYIPRDSRENQHPAIVLDAAAGDIAGLDPVADDLGRVNTFQATRQNGSTYTFTDTSSTLSVARIGEYPDSKTINCQTDDYLPHYAGFKVNIGTVDDYRYPLLTLAMHSAPRVLPAWLAATVSSRIDVVNLSDIRVSQDPKDLSLMLEGWTETIDKFTWTVAANTTSYEPWRVAVLAADTGDTGEFVGRLESDGSATVGETPAASVALTVATPSGPLWTTAADDFPLDLNAGGVHVTATAASGAASPQTFTVNPTPMRIPDGSAVTVWRNPVLAI